MIWPPQCSAQVKLHPPSRPPEILGIKNLSSEGVTTYAALKKSGANSGHWVVIAGAGGGLGTVAVSLGAKAMGYRVIGIDTLSKKDVILDSGAEHFIDVMAYDDDGIANRVRELTGHGAKAVIVVSTKRTHAPMYKMIPIPLVRANSNHVSAL